MSFDKLKEEVVAKCLDRDKSIVKSVVSCCFNLVISLIKIVVFFCLSLLVYIPIILFLMFRNLFTGNGIYQKMDILCKGSKLRIRLFNFENWLLKRTSLLPLIMLGKMNLVGNSFLDYNEFAKNSEIIPIKEIIKPGIFNLWFIRESIKIGHEGLIKTEYEYLLKKSIKTDLSIILKSIPALMYRSSHSKYEELLTIFDLEFINITMKNAIDIIKETIIKGNKKKFFFVNPDCMNKLYKDKKYYNILNKADYVFPDGIGISIACNKLGTPLIENVNGTDMFPFICDMAEANEFKLFLFGAKPGVANKMKNNLLKIYPKLNITGTRDGYFDWKSDSKSIIKQINESGADILLVAFGVPLQEQWLSENSKLLQPNVLMGVGGLFDFYSGEMQRAPKWMREIGMEWLYRLYKEPKRMWKRYIIGNPLFLYRVSKWKKERENKNG